MFQIRDEVKEIPVRDEASICANDIVSLLETALSWSDIEPLIRKRAKELLDCCINDDDEANLIAKVLDCDAAGEIYTP